MSNQRTNSMQQSSLWGANSSQIVKKFPTWYRSWKFFSMHTTAQVLPLS